MSGCWALRPFRAWFLYRVHVSQGVALGYHIKPRWGRRPVPRWGRRPAPRWGGRRDGWCVAMMFGDGICGGVAPFQGLVSLSGSCCPRALPWAITLSPVGAEDRRPVGAEDQCPVGAEDRCARVSSKCSIVGQNQLLADFAKEILCFR